MTTHAEDADGDGRWKIRSAFVLQSLSSASIIASPAADEDGK